MTFCQSLWMLFGWWMDGWLDRGWGTAGLYFSTRAWISEHLFPMFFSTDRCIIIKFWITVLSNPLNNFMYHLEPSFHSSKYGCSIWSLHSFCVLIIVIHHYRSLFALYFEVQVVFVVHQNHSNPLLILPYEYYIPRMLTTVLAFLHLFILYKGQVHRHVHKALFPF